jgi:hypothetical protein
VAIAVFGTIAAIGFVIYHGGGRLLHDLKETEVARGLSTFLLILTAVLIAIIYDFYAMFGGTNATKDFDGNKLKDRFT